VQDPPGSLSLAALRN